MESIALRIHSGKSDDNTFCMADLSLWFHLIVVFVSNHPGSGSPPEMERKMKVLLNVQLTFNNLYRGFYRGKVSKKSCPPYILTMR